MVLHPRRVPRYSEHIHGEPDHKEDMWYPNIGTSWYAENYPRITTTQFTNPEGCLAFRAEPSALLYVVPDAGSCDPLPNATITRLYDATMMTKDN